MLPADVRRLLLDWTRQPGYDSIKDYLAAMYAETFTEQELEELSAFYRTPVGRKSIKTMPKIDISAIEAVRRG